MSDNCIQKNCGTCKFKGQPAILVLDPTGCLTPVRWRLKSDGFNVLWSGYPADAEALAAQNDVRIVILEISHRRDLTNLRAVCAIKRDFKFIVFMTGNNLELKEKVYALGVRMILNKPVNLPGLSLFVGEALRKTDRRKFSQRIFEKRRGRILPGLPRAYKAVFDHVDTAVLVTDSQGLIVYVNRLMTLLLEINEDYLIDRHYCEVMEEFAGACQYEILAVMQKARQNPEVSGPVEIMAGNGTDVLLPVKAEAHQMFDQRGSFIGAFLVVGDLLGSGRFDRAAAQSEKLAMVGQLAAGAVHEIKNPLTSVKGFIQLLQKESESSPKAEYFKIIIDEIDRVNNIVNEFLQLAKPAQPKRKPADLKKLWEDIRLLVENKAFLHQIKIIEDLPRRIKPVLLDCEQIKQVLINVVLNSFEAMPEGGNLTVRLYENDYETAACLEISDTGIGMDEETARRIFVPFFTTKETGTGLGLAVSAAIIENHGGHMEMTSQIGAGTTTLIYFPYDPA